MSTSRVYFSDFYRDYRYICDFSQSHFFSKTQKYVDSIAILLYYIGKGGLHILSLTNVNPKKIEKAAEIFKGFGNPIRIRIIDLLKDRGSLRVKEISEELNFSQPIISQQLKILKGNGIVSRVKKKHSYMYELTDPHFADMIKCMKGCLGL